jgi:rubrerythrin
MLLSKIPVNLKNVAEEDIDKEILRAGIIAELDAVNLYEQMAALTKNENIRAVLRDVAKEEKTHIGEFQALLLRFDDQQKKELEAGAKEAEKELSK